jgi:hypothetical protein
MEWFVLIFLVPLVILPIVLLCGFAGCGIDTLATGTGPGVEAPSDLHAKATGVDTIELKWQNNTGGPTNFEIVRAASATSNYSEIGQTGATTLTDNKQLEAVVNKLVDGLVEGRTYFYRVRVNIPSNPDGGVPCQEVRTTTFPATPTNLAATALDATHIKLSWNNASATAKKFIVQHRPSPISAWDAKPVYTGPETVLPNSTSPAPAITGTEDEFRVTAVVVNGFDDNVPKEVESVPSAPISAVTSIQIPPAFKTAYDEGSLTTDAPFGPNETLVQRIPAANLQNSGAKVRITLAKTTTDLVIDKITVSQVKPGGKPYDSANDLKEVTSGGKSGVSLKAVDLPKVLDVIDYNLDRTKDLLIAFHIPGNSFSCREKTVIGARMFHKPNTNEADKPAAFNRAVGYVTAVGPTPPGTGGVYLVRAIEVA